jgi:LysM repeat protein
MILVKLIKDYHLQDYSLIALGKIKPEEEWLATVKNNSTPIISTDATLYPVIEVQQKKSEEPVNIYPEGEFRINETRVVYAKAGTSLLVLADQYNIGLKRLLDFNELKKEDENTLPNGQLIYLQRKRKMGANEFHIVSEGESVYDICQAEAIRMETLLEYNHLANGMQPAVGEKLYLRTVSPERPELISALRKKPTEIIPVTPGQPDNSYTTHVVKTKETLYAISKKYNVPVEKLKEWNRLVSYELKKGQELIIYKN